MNKDSKKSYGQIIKSSALIGGSTVINVGLGMIRTKVMAVLLGTAGMGLFGNYGRITDLVRTLAGMGINVSGVRQIAEAVGTGEEERVARTVTSLRRVAVLTGALGALLLLIFCKPVARLMFDDGTHAGAVALLALVVFFADVSAGQMALVQGMRRISDLARLSVWGAVFGTAFSIPIVWFYCQRGDGARGVVPSLICAGAMSILASWWYARKVRVARVSLSWRELAGEAKGLLKMGVVFMSSQFMTMGSAFAVGAIITHLIGLEQAGLYYSAWVLGGVYMGYILQAMGADFYPRLTAVARDDRESNRLVNEQVEVGLLVAIPGVLATLTFTPLVIQVFYSVKFGAAVELLRWYLHGHAAARRHLAHGLFSHGAWRAKAVLLDRTSEQRGLHRPHLLRGEGIRPDRRGRRILCVVCPLWPRHVPGAASPERVPVVQREPSPRGDLRSAGGRRLCRAIFSPAAGRGGSWRGGDPAFGRVFGEDDLPFNSDATIAAGGAEAARSLPARAGR